VPVDRSETGAQLGSDGVPAQGKLEALRHGAPACCDHRSRVGQWIANGIRERLLTRSRGLC
jgi:hypothetical protein